jgi:hypothetical protein
MVDESSPTPETENATDVPPKPVAETPPKIEASSNDTPPVITNKAPPDSVSAKRANDIHAPHPHYKWHSEVMVDGHNVYQGIAKDISINGLNLILDQNLQNAKLVKMHIHVPPLDTSSHDHVMEISGKVISSIYDNDEESFRSGVSFTQFTLDSDRTYLQSLLS